MFLTLTTRWRSKACLGNGVGWRGLLGPWYKKKATALSHIFFAVYGNKMRSCFSNAQVGSSMPRMLSESGTKGWSGPGSKEGREEGWRRDPGSLPPQACCSCSSRGVMELWYCMLQCGGLGSLQTLFSGLRQVAGLLCSSMSRGG